MTKKLITEDDHQAQRRYVIAACRGAGADADDRVDTAPQASEHEAPESTDFCEPMETLESKETALITAKAGDQRP